MPTAAPRVALGRSAVAFALPSADGKIVSLKGLRGKDVILYFYPNDETPGCTKEACGFRDEWAAIRKAGATVVGVSPNSAASHLSFAKNHRLPFPLLSDPDRKVMKAYGAFGPKVLYGKHTIGVIRSTVWIGPDGRVRKHWKRVADAAKHPKQVLEALRGAPEGEAPS